MTKEKPLILALFNSSRYAVEPWLTDGRFTVVSVDYDDTDHAGEHRDRMAGISLDLSREKNREWLVDHYNPSLVLSFPPCTDLAVSGAKHFSRKLSDDPECQRRGVEMARLASRFGCPYVIENPVSVLSTLWRKPDYYWHPWHYAGFCPEGKHPEFPGIIPEQDRYCKKTGAWVGNGFIRPAEAPMVPLEFANIGWAKLGGKSARTKYIRSLTPRGWARAVFEANYVNILQK
jgi:hypothetical protein